MRAPKNDKIANIFKRPQRDLPTSPNVVKLGQEMTRKLQELQQELQHINVDIHDTRENQVLSPDGVKTAQTQRIEDNKILIIQENDKEAAEKEARFQQVRSEVRQLNEQHTVRQQEITTLETYQRSLEQEQQENFSFNLTTHTLSKQLALLDTAITSLQEEIAQKQAESPPPQDLQQSQQLLTEFTTKKASLEQDRQFNSLNDAQAPALDKQLTDVEASIQRTTHKISEVDKRLTQATKDRESLFKRETAPQHVTQNFTDQVSMVQDHIRYLELEITNKQQSKQRLQERADALEAVGEEQYLVTRAHTNPYQDLIRQIASLDRDLTRLNQKLTDEKSYAQSLGAEKALRLEKNTLVEYSLEEALDTVRKSIASAEKFVTSLQKKQGELQHSGDQASARQIAERIVTINDFIQGRKNYAQYLEASLQYQRQRQQAISESPVVPSEPQRLGVYTQEEFDRHTQKATIEMSRDDLRINANNYIAITQDRIQGTTESLQNIHNQLQRARETNNVTHIEALQAQEKHMTEELQQLQADLQVGQKRPAELAQSRERAATQLTVSRPIHEQLTMLQNLQRLHEQYEPNPERSIQYANAQQKLRQRIEAPVRKQQDHIRLLRIESQTKKTALDKLVTEAESLLKNRDAINNADFTHRMDVLRKQSTTLVNERENINAQIKIEEAHLQNLMRAELFNQVPQTILTSDGRKKLAVIDSRLKNLQAEHDTLQKDLEQAREDKQALQKKREFLSSEHIQIHLELDKQRVLVDRNLQYLRKENELSIRKLATKTSEQENLRQRIVNLSFCKDNLLDHSLYNALGQPDNPAFNAWNEYKKYLATEIQQLQNDIPDDVKLIRSLQEERLKKAEQLEKDMQAVKGQDLGTLHVQQQQEWSYAEKLDKQRDQLRETYQKTAAARTWYDQRYKEYSKDVPLAARDQLSNPLTEIGRSFEALQQELTNQQQRVTKAIQESHARLKDIAKRKGENKHSYFLNEHMLPIEMFSKFGIAPPAGSHIFLGTPESACVPTAVRIICHDADPGFAGKAKEVADAFQTHGDGGAHLDDIPAAFEKLRHPVKYTVASIQSVHQIGVSYDKHGKPLPSIITIQQNKSPNSPTHVVVLDNIVAINNRRYAFVRDSLILKPFAIRLDHLDEVLSDPQYANIAYPIIPGA